MNALCAQRITGEMIFFLSFLCNSMGSKKVDYSKEGGFVAILIRVIPLSRMRSMTLMT